MPDPINITHTATARLSQEQVEELLRRAVGAPEDAEIVFRSDEGDEVRFELSAIVEWTPVHDGRRRGGLPKSSATVKVA